MKKDNRNNNKIGTNEAKIKTEIGTKKFTSKFKLIYALSEVIIFYICSGFFPGYDLLAILGLVIVYLVPLYINSYYIKFLDRTSKLSSYYFEDLIYYYLPSIGTSLIAEIVLYFAGAIDIILGFYTVVLFIIFTLLTLFQWLRYFLQFKMTRSHLQQKSETE